MNNNEILKDAPRYIVARFNAINNYTWRIMFPDNDLTARLRTVQGRSKRAEELSRIKTIVSEASLVVFIFLLRRFFNEGTRAAAQAVDTLKGVGIPALQIGSKTFTERNENVMMGEELAKNMIASIKDQKLLELIDNSFSASDIIHYYKRMIYA
jgi:hypothetical protein